MDSNLLLAVPMLHVSDCKNIKNFYCKKLGFKIISEYKPNNSSANPVYVIIKRDQTGLHLSSFSGDGKPGGVAVIYVKNVDSLFREFQNQGVEVGKGPVNQSWGDREMYITDPDGINYDLHNQ